MADKEMVNEFVNGKDITLKNIKMDMAGDSDNIQKISFDTDTGLITWKPKVEKSDYIVGLERIKTVVMTIQDIPLGLKDLGKTISEKGKIKLKINYTLGKVMQNGVQVVKDGVPEEYRFITSLKTFNDWKVI